MKRLILGICLVLLLASPCLSKTVYVRTALTGGATTALDGIDGGVLAEGDIAYVTYQDSLYVYYLNATSGATQSLPAIVAPATNPGTKRWIAQGWGMPVASKMGTFTRDTATATGTQAITGVGFKPSVVIFLAVTGVSPEVSVGWDNGATALSLVNLHNQTAATWSSTGSVSIELVQTGSIYLTGKITSMDSNGFTITWTKYGSKTGTATIHYLAFR